ncbi:murein hydrolase activator EnvC family protein [Scatolibacter rhodanostii]|uniref:murein hydrolase activator EnvC family protein n=1 Tax=Scatolibacter rhodanostii TaxID=2014781 RepID=UPI000C081F99|nr:M23 family metallopeptidase [Scatolibacter rhodanostii]
MSAKHSRRKSKLIRFLAVILCACMMVPTLGVSAADTLAEVQAETDRLSQQKDELNAKLSSLEADEAQKTEYQATLQQQMSVVASEIAALEEEITLLDKKIGELEVKLEAAQAEMGDTFELFYERVIAIYTSGSSQLSTLEILLNADSLHDFTMKANILQSIDEHDSIIINKIQDYLTATETDREELRTSQEELANSKKERDSHKAELTDLSEKNKVALASISEAKQLTSDEIADVEAQKEAADAEMARLIEEKRQQEEAARQQAEAERQKQLEEQKNNSPSDGGYTPSPSDDPDDTYTPPSTGGSWQWPLPGGIVTQYYKSGQHRGMDISSGGGSQVRAAQGGTVLVANATDSWGSGWGYYVLIYHDGTYSSRYAHMDSLVVSAGQTVSAGQVLGYEGNTGDSYGAHLHFEVLENGTRVDPQPFIGG